MSSIRFNSVPVLLALTVCGLNAQSVLVSVQSPSSKVLVHGTMQVAAAITSEDGTPLDPSTLTWSSSDEKIAAVSAGGLVTGLIPGDASVRITDTNTGTAASISLHVVPASMSIQVSPPTFAVGETAQISASALDAAGKTISGLRFQYRSGQASVATIAADGAVTGVAEGFATIEAAIIGVAKNPAMVVTTQIRVLPKPRYKIRKLISTDTPGPTTIAAVNTVTAVGPSATAAIVTLANGGQAAILMEGAKTTVLAAAGQALPGSGRMVLRIDGISINSRGDAALLIEYPNQWCVASVFLIRHGQPDAELGSANCGNGLSPHALSDDGAVIYRYNDQVWSASIDSQPKMLFSLATQPTLKDPIRSVNSVVAGGGAFVVGGPLNSGATGYFWSDGKTFTQVYRTGDSVRGVQTNSIDTPVGSAAGLFYARANGSSSVALVQLGPTGPQTVLATGDPVGSGKLGWIQSVTDASSAGVLFAGDFATPPSYHSSVGLWTNSATTELATLAGYSGLISGALPTSGTPLVSAVLQGDTSVPGLRALPTGDTPNVVLAAGSNFPQPAPAGIDWHYPSRGGSATLLPVRGAGESIVAVDGAVRTLAVIGSPLPNGKIATWIGAAISNNSGDILFTAGYPTGSALFRYRGGKLETMQDTGVTGSTALVSVSWFNSYRGRYLALNNRGDAVHVSQFYGGSIPQIVLIAENATKLVAALNVPAPSGQRFTSFGSTALDDNGRVVFTATTVDGRVAAYFWDGNTVERVIGTGDKTPSGTVNEISNVAGGGSGFVIMLALDNYRARELRYFDGHMRTIESTDTSLLNGVWMNYFWMNESTLSANGDVHYQVNTQDGGVGVYSRRADGSLAVVARSRDPLPGGEWLIFPLTVSSALAGEVYFTGHTWKGGIEALGLYVAIPQ